MLFVNMPVADLERSKTFFASLGFNFNPAFTGETAACMQVGEQASVMLLTREMFDQFSHRPMADPATHALALLAKRQRPPQGPPAPPPDPST